MPSVISKPTCSSIDADGHIRWTAYAGGGREGSEPPTVSSQTTGTASRGAQGPLTSDRSPGDNAMNNDTVSAPRASHHVPRRRSPLHRFSVIDLRANNMINLLFRSYRNIQFTAQRGAGRAIAAEIGRRGARRSRPAVDDDAGPGAMETSLIGEL